MDEWGAAKQPYLGQSGCVWNVLKWFTMPIESKMNVWTIVAPLIEPHSQASGESLQRRCLVALVTCPEAFSISYTSPERKVNRIMIKREAISYIIDSGVKWIKLLFCLFIFIDLCVHFYWIINTSPITQFTVLSFDLLDEDRKNWDIIYHKSEHIILVPLGQLSSLYILIMLLVIIICKLHHTYFAYMAEYIPISNIDVIMPTVTANKISSKLLNELHFSLEYIFCYWGQLQNLSSVRIHLLAIAYSF